MGMSYYNRVGFRYKGSIKANKDSVNGGNKKQTGALGQRSATEKGTTTSNRTDDNDKTHGGGGGSRNILVRFYKRYVMDNYEQDNYDCDNFSKL